MRLFFFLSIFSCQILFSQKSNIVKYYVQENIGAETYDRNDFLIFDTEKSYYLKLPHKVYKNFDELSADEAYLNDNKKKISLQKYLGSNTFLAVESVPRPFKSYLYSDTQNFSKKNIKNSDVKILGYQCKLLETEFRGRKYKIWFTEEIPVDYGPWKFFGLPGLVLKVAEEKNLYVFEATQINLNTDAKVPEKIKTVYENQAETAITFKEFVDKFNASLEEIRDRAIANMPKNVVPTNTPPIRSLLLETKMEW